MSDMFSPVQFYHQALDYHLERHNVVSSNIAHVDTPGTNPGVCDLERNGVVDNADFILWQENYGSTSGAGGLVEIAGVPEPCSVMLLLLAAAELFAARRRM